MSTDAPQETEVNIRIGGEDAAEIDPEILRDVFGGLEKALKIRRLYEPNHRLRGESEVETVARFSRALAVLDTLTVDITPDALVVDGIPVLREPRRENAIPYKLFRDGVRSLTFEDGLTASEVVRFLTVLETPPDAPGNIDEDMATLLWNEDFSHIQFVAIDEIGVGDSSQSGSGPFAEMGHRMEQILTSITSPEASVGESRSSGVRVAADHREIFEMERRGFSAETSDDEDEDLVAVSQAAITALQKEIEDDDAGAVVARMVEILFDMIRNSECALPVDQVRGIFSQFIWMSLEQGDLPYLNKLLDRLVLGRIGPGGEQLQELVNGLLGDLAGEPMMSLLLRSVRGEYQGGPDDLSQYLFRLPSPALGPAARHCNELPPGPEKAVYRRLLRSRARENPEAMILSMEDCEPEELIEALEVCVEESDVGLAEVVAQLIGNPDSHVRAEAVKVIVRVDASERAPLLERVVFDAEPAVRANALRIIESTKEQKLFDTLAGLVDGANPVENEWMAILHAIAVLGGMRAVDCLRRHVGSKTMTLFTGKKAVAARRAAIIGLADVEDKTVRGFLSGGANSRNRKFADACRSALAVRRNTKDRNP